MLSITECRTAKLAHVNLRSEKHGKDHKAAIDLALEIEQPNEFLNEIAPGLLDSLYEVDHNPKQGSLVENGRMTKLKYPNLAPLKFDREHHGYEVVIEHGTRQLSFHPCKVNKFEIHAKEGGSILLSLRAQTVPELKQLGDLATHIEKPIVVSLIPPEAAQKELAA